MINRVPINVMFVEDDPDTLAALLLNIQTWGVVNPVKCFPTCEEAWAYIEGSTSLQLPDVLFLDRFFGIGAMQGDELLKKIRSNPQYDSINIAMMTGGKTDITLVDYYHHLGVKGFFDKPIPKSEFDDFMNKMEFRLETTWLKEKDDVAA